MYNFLRFILVGQIVPPLGGLRYEKTLGGLKVKAIKINQTSTLGTIPY